MTADPIARPFYAFVGIEVDPREDQSVIRLPYRPDLGNSRDHVHGGAIATLLDASMSRAVRLANPQAAGVVTINITIHYLAPGIKDLTAEGRVVSSGGTIAVAESEARSDNGALVARATATFRLFKFRPVTPPRQEDAHADRQ